jgi:uncharacterized protein YhaN
MQDSFEMALAIGEMRGQLKELVHSMNGKSTRDEEFVRAIAKLQTLPDDVAAIRASVNSLESRMAGIETSNAARNGERNLLFALLKSPLLGWVFGAVSILSLLLQGS